MPDNPQGPLLELAELGTAGALPATVVGPDEMAAEWIQLVVERFGDTLAKALDVGRWDSFTEQRVEQRSPEDFDRIRTLAGVRECYVEDVCGAPLQAAPAWVRKPGAWQTASGRLLLQAVDATSADFLAASAGKLADHLERHPDSLLSKFVGLYSVGPDVLPQGRIHVAVLTNDFLLPGRPMDYMYSVNGISPNRFVRRTGEKLQLLYDANFIEEQQVMMVPAETHDAISRALAEDTAFLAEANAFGYSLLVGVRKSLEEGEEEKEEEKGDWSPVSPQATTSFLRLPTFSGVPSGASGGAPAAASFSSSAATSPRSAAAAAGASSGGALLPIGAAMSKTQHPTGSRKRREDGFRGWRSNREPVEYFLCIVNTLKRDRRGMMPTVLRGPTSFMSPRRYRATFLAFIEDRLLPISDNAALLWESSVIEAKCDRVHKRRGAWPAEAVNTLALVAAAELEDARRPSKEDVARWRALVDVLEAGQAASGLWRELGLAEAGIEQLLPVFRADLWRRPLPAFSGPEDHVQKPGGIARKRIDKLLKSVHQARAMHTIGGGLVSASSTQYSLALAIAVGVEAATLCSARIAQRSADVFARYPELHRRPAAVFARRNYFLPEAGTWLSPPHMLPDLHFVEYAPEIFQDIRASIGFDDRAYVECVCPRDFSFIEFMSNSKSGEFFFFTHDGRCMVKTISHKEARTLLRLIRMGYVEHVEAEEGSLLTRILGLYQVQLPWFNNGGAQCFIVQENLLHSCGPSIVHRFDLKGSTHGRTAKKDDTVMKDNDWLCKGMALGFTGDDGESVRRQHQRDCEFLAACGVIDYSLFVVGCLRSTCVASVVSTQQQQQQPPRQPKPKHQQGRRSGPRLSMVRSITEPAPAAHASRGVELWDRARHEYMSSARDHDRPLQGLSLTEEKNPHGPHNSPDGLCHFLGIIDYLIPWCWQKRAEFVYRSAQCRMSESSVNPPWSYARRQIAFMRPSWSS